MVGDNRRDPQRAHPAAAALAVALLAGAAAAVALLAAGPAAGRLGASVLAARAPAGPAVGVAAGCGSCPGSDEHPAPDPAARARRDLRALQAAEWWSFDDARRAADLARWPEGAGLDPAAARDLRARAAAVIDLRIARGAMPDDARALLAALRAPAPPAHGARP